jgi:hypothetical protein
MELRCCRRMHFAFAWNEQTFAFDLGGCLFGGRTTTRDECRPTKRNLSNSVR